MQSRSVVRSRRRRSMVPRISEWSRITPLGKPVVPDVYMMNTVSVALIAAARRRTAARVHALARRDHVGEADRPRMARVALDH